MSPLLTPPEDYSPLEEAHSLLDAIRSTLADSTAFRDLEDEPVGLYASYLYECASLGRQLVLALQTAGGRAQRRVEAAARARGLEECLLCRRWLPREQVIRRTTGGKNERSNSYWTCLDCGGPEEDPLKGDQRR